MGSRGRSIRLRIYFLVAIPLIAMVGLLAYVASTTVNNAVNLTEPRLFLAEANSLTNAVAAGQALGLIATVSAREALSQEYALLSGMLAGQRSTQADRAAFSQMVATRQGDIVDAESVLNQSNLATFLKQVSNDGQTQLAGIETAVTAGTPG